MTGTTFALILYSYMVAHKAACHTLSNAFLKSMKTLYRLGDIEGTFTQNSEAEDLFCGASPSSEPNLLFSNYLFS